MAKKLLVPVFPSERFYEAVLRAADILVDEGGLIVFAFTKVRPQPEENGGAENGWMSELDVKVESGDVDPDEIEAWKQKQVAALEEARQLLYERGIRDGQIDYLFLDEADHEGTAQAIADEAAAGAYDAVILSRGYFENEVNELGETYTPEDVAKAVTELDGPYLIVA